MTATPQQDTDPPELRAIRARIDQLDLDLVDLIARRAALAWSTAPVKSARGLAFKDHRREAELVRRAAALARERGIDPEPVRAIFWRLLELSHRGAGAACPGASHGADPNGGGPRG